MAAKRSRPENGAFDNRISFKKLHLKSQWSDVNFIFKSGESTAECVPAHKMILAAQSDVFGAMFYGELKEKGDVTVTDASIDAFKEFLQFFYLNRVQLTVGNVADVMNLGHKYNVTKCVDTCVQFLKGVLSGDNVWSSLSLAILYEQQELKECCERYIAVHSEAVFKSNSFLECDKHVLAHILKLDSLYCSETVVFEACMSWIKAKSEQSVVTKQLIQEHLGVLFYDFRFTSLTVREFDALNTAYEHAFSLGEYKNIMRTFASPYALPTLFNKNPRQRPWNEHAVIVCDRKEANSTMGGWYVPYNKPTKFESNQSLLLGTLVFAPISILRNGDFRDLESDFPIDVTVIEVENLSNSADGPTRTLSNFKINLPSQKKTSITLPAPVLVRPGYNYEIRLDPQQSAEDYYCRGGSVLAEIQLENNLSFKFHGDRIHGRWILNIITALGFNKI